MTLGFSFCLHVRYLWNISARQHKHFFHGMLRESKMVADNTMTCLLILICEAECRLPLSLLVFLSLVTF